MSIVIIGAGNVGCTIAYTLLLKNIASHITLVDINKDRCEGEALDLADALAFCQTATIQQGDFSHAKTADIIIISAGYPQKPGEPRLNLYNKNKAIIQNIMSKLADHLQPTTLIIMVTNPVDLMTLVAQETDILPRHHIFGSGTLLDTQRLKRYVGNALDIHPTSLNISIIGEHGDSQCVVWSHASCNGVSLNEMGLSQTALETFATKARNDAYTIIEKKCATYYGVAACVVDLCEIIAFDKKEIVPVSTYLPEFNVCMSVPVILGAHGVERTVPLKLAPEETACLKKSADQLCSLINQSMCD